jgi:hypothetical protein
MRPRMKLSRAMAGLAMILALLGLIAHEHDSDEARDDCPAAAWHSGAVQCASPLMAPPGQPEQIIAVVTPSVAPPAAQMPQLFRPRGPPSTLL